MIYTKAEKRKIIAALQRLQSGEIIFPSMGICANLESIIVPRSLKLSYLFIRYYSTDWEEHSEDVGYPCGKHLYPWEGEKLLKRQRLITFLITKLKVQLKHSHKVMEFVEIYE